MQTRSRQLTLTVALLFGLIVASFWAPPVSAFFGHRGGFIAADFATLYSAGDRVAQGHPGDLYRPESLRPVQDAALHDPDRGPLAYLNPPFFAVLLAPFALVSFDTAFQLWTLLNVAAITMSAWMIAPLVRPLRLPVRAALIA